MDGDLAAEPQEPPYPAPTQAALDLIGGTSEEELRPLVEFASKR